MSNPTIGNVSVSVSAGPIRESAQPADPIVGKMVMMGDSLYLHIKPEVAAQWLPVIQKIAEGKK